MPSKKKKSDTVNVRKTTAKFYYFVVGVELFSRYAFVTLVDRNELVVDKTPILKDDPSVDKEAELAQIQLFNKKYSPKGEEVVRIFKEWFMVIARNGYILCNVVSDNGPEFNNKEVKAFLDNGADGIFDEVLKDENKKLKENGFQELDKISIGLSTTIANDRVANPIAERFIGTFKRLLGQYLTAKKLNIQDKIQKGEYKEGDKIPDPDLLTQEDVDEIVAFYNSRIHSSTQYAPDDVVKMKFTVSDLRKEKEGKEFKEKPYPISDKQIEENDDTLFDFYRHQKGQMYYDQDDSYADVRVGTVVRLYSKWLSADQNIGDKKSNQPNWSFSFFKVQSYDPKERTYVLDLISFKDRNQIFPMKEFTGKGSKEKKEQYDALLRKNMSPNDSKMPLPTSRGVRRDLFKVIDFNDFLKYNSV